jgi:hypothetical protein
LFRKGGPSAQASHHPSKHRPQHLDDLDILVQKHDSTYNNVQSTAWRIVDSRTLSAGKRVPVWRRF